MATSKKAASVTKAASSVTRPKAGGKPKTKAASVKTAAVTKAAPATPAKKAAPAKLTDKQREVLSKIQSAGETGYEAVGSAEVRVIKSLADRKLIKAAPKAKGQAKPRVLLTKTGQKQASTPAPATAASTSPAP